MKYVSVLKQGGEERRIVVEVTCQDDRASTFGQPFSSFQGRPFWALWMDAFNTLVKCREPKTVSSRVLR